MTKAIITPEHPETITIPRSSFDAMFRQMEAMQEEIDKFKQELNERTN